MNLWGKLICWWMKGHLRGKAQGSPVRRYRDFDFPEDSPCRVQIYQCPRCKATWTRRVKAKSAGAQS